MVTLSLLAVAAAPIGAAQPTPPSAQPRPEASGTPLEIPQNVAFVGTPSQPNVARASAIVNEEIITRSDIDQRLALFLAAQPDVQVPADELELLRDRVLRNLIDEALQIQTAKEREITIERREIDRFYERFAQNFGHTSRSLGDYLRTIGASERTVKRQIEGELAWTQLQRRMPRPSVTDEEIRIVMERILASRGQPEYRVSELFMYATPENATQVRQRLGQVIQQIRGGASFAAYARQFGETTVAAVGGDLGWVKADQLPAEISAVVQQMPPGAISDPIQLPDGFSVVVLNDERRVLTANPRDAVLTLIQMSITLPANTTEAVARQRAEQLAQVTSTMGGCGGVDQAKARLGPGVDSVSADGRRVRDLPAVLQETLLQMNVGQVTPPFGTTERVSVLVLCGRDDPEAVTDPTAATVGETIEQQRIARQSQRLLRDLRRDAVVEYR